MPTQRSILGVREGKEREEGREGEREGERDSLERWTEEGGPGQRFG